LRLALRVTPMPHKCMSIDLVSTTCLSTALRSCKECLFLILSQMILCLIKFIWKYVKCFDDV
jgi:hypothetical protein